MSRIIAFYKPYAVLSQFTGGGGRLTLKKFISIPDVYPAGRLDYRSEGLMLLTDDGPLIHQLTHPSHEHIKTYLAQVEGVPTLDEVHTLETKIVLPDIQTRTARAEVIPDPGLPSRSKPVRDYHPTSWLRIVLTEGKKHQVRKMTATIGYPTLRLVRVAIGDIPLGNLQPGDWRWLTPEEETRLKKKGTEASNS